MTKIQIPGKELKDAEYDVRFSSATRNKSKSIMGYYVFHLISEILAAFVVFSTSAILSSLNCLSSMVPFQNLVTMART